MMLKRLLLSACMLAGSFRFVDAESADIPSLVKKAKAAIVEILTFDKQNKPLMSGTGFFISPDGLLLTNYHVIAGGSSIIAKTPTGSVYFLKEIVATSQDPDVAELQFLAKDVPHLSLGSSADAVEGQHILVIGNPEGLEGTVTDGIISAFRDDRTLIQITAALSPGSSGSPVIDDSGNVIGIATKGYKDGQSLNFAIVAETIRIALGRATSNPQNTVQSATKEHPWTNSLGMRFAPVPETRVLFSAWDTRVQDFEVFVQKTEHDAIGGMWSFVEGNWKQEGATWRSPGFQQTPTDPVVGVNWMDAKSFCDWLTKTEHANNYLPKELLYRLPTDAEWSVAVGLGHENGTTPREKFEKFAGGFPWGQEWPPPKGAGNYAGEELKLSNPSYMIKGYNDGWPYTSPVGSFTVNKFGLYDMGGNVWQWCEDRYDGKTGLRVLRGASWSIYSNLMMISAHRIHGSPDERQSDCGFRCVIAPAVSPE